MVTVLRTPARPSKVHSLVEHGVIIMKNILARFLKDESGATAIEYGLIAAGISVAIISVVTALGGKLISTFTAVEQALK
jgi:pilus assembly protein Flp/PilA